MLAGPQREFSPEGRVGFQRQGDAAGGLSPDRDDLGAGIAKGPGRLHQLGVTVDAVRAGKQVDQR